MRIVGPQGLLRLLLVGSTSALGSTGSVAAWQGPDKRGWIYRRIAETMASGIEEKRNRCLRLKLVGIFRRNRPRKAPGKQAHKSVVVIIRQGIITPGTEFRYDGSSTGRHFPKPIQAVLGHSSHEDCKGVIVVLKEESTREITVKVSPTAKEKQN